MNIEEQVKIRSFLNSIDPSKTTIHFCERFNEKSNIWNFKKHKHEFLEIIYFLDGNASVQFTKKTIELSVYDMMTYPPNVEHREFLDMKCHQEVICLWVKFPLLESLSFSFKLSDRNGTIRWLVEQIHHEYNNEKPFSNYLIPVYLSALLLNIKRYFTDKAIIKQDFIETITEYIYKYFASEITLTQLSSIANVSSSYLNRFFKKKFKKSPIQYINELRLETARHFLTSSEFSIKEISRLVGFKDANYFWRLFKRFNSCSPSEYRKKNM